MRQAFDIGREAVKNEPHILRAGAESDKFLLLPEDGDHAIALCKALPDGPLFDLSPPPCAHNLPAFFPLQFVGRQPEVPPLTLTLTLTLTLILTLSRSSKALAPTLPSPLTRTLLPIPNPQP